MKLDIDPAYLLTCMRLWRDSTDLKIPMQDDFKMHFMEQRGTILESFKSTSGAWLMALRRAVPDAGDQAEFEELLARIEEFEGWATTELQAIQGMAVAEEIQAGMEDLMRDPGTAKLLRGLAKKLRPPKDEG